MAQEHQYCVAGIAAPNAVTPGALVLARGIYSRASWTSDLRAIEVLQVEWVDRPGGGLLERISAAHTALHAIGDKPVGKWEERRAGDVRVVVATNFWANAAHKLQEARIQADALVSIVAGDAPPRMGMHTSVGRMYLLDLLRDSVAKLSVSLPTDAVEGHPHIVVAHDLRAAMREIAHRPRTIDEETMAPGLDRGDVLVLCLGMAADDLTRNGPVDDEWGDNINARFSGGDGGRRDYVRGYRR